MRATFGTSDSNECSDANKKRRTCRTKRGSGMLIVLVLCACSLFLLACLEPTPGRGDWFISLGGDWSTAIDYTGYEVGGTPNNFEGRSIFRWAWVTTSSGRKVYAMQEGCDSVVQCASDGLWILAQRSSDRWSWINSDTHEVAHAKSIKDLKEKAPSEVVRLIDDLQEPRSSHRILFIFLGMCFVVAFLYLLLSRKSRTGQVDHVP